MSNSSNSQFLIFKNTVSIFQIFRISNSEIPKFKNSKRFGTSTFQHFQSYRFPYLQQNNMFQKCVHLAFRSIFGIFKSINTGLQGFTNPEIMEMLGFGPSDNKAKILLDQK